LKDVQMREQADVIQAEVGHLLLDATRLDDRVSALERHFGQTVDDVRKIRISTDKVLRRGERIGELQLETEGPKPEDGAGELPLAAPPIGAPTEPGATTNISHISGDLRPHG